MNAVDGHKQTHVTLPSMTKDSCHVDNQQPTTPLLWKQSVEGLRSSPQGGSPKAHSFPSGNDVFCVPSLRAFICPVQENTA
jgi:hypothetical protein